MVFHVFFFTPTETKKSASELNFISITAYLIIRDIKQNNLSLCAFDELNKGFGTQKSLKAVFALCVCVHNKLILKENTVD